MVSRQPPYELAARFASSMLTAFPPPRRPGPPRPSQGYPAADAVATDGSREPGAHPARAGDAPAALPSSGPLAALAELVKAPAPNAGTGMPVAAGCPAVYRHRLRSSRGCQRG